MRLVAACITSILFLVFITFSNAFAAATSKVVAGVTIEYVTSTSWEFNAASPGYFGANCEQQLLSSGGNSSTISGLASAGIIAGGEVTVYYDDVSCLVSDVAVKGVSGSGQAVSPVLFAVNDPAAVTEGGAITFTVTKWGVATSEHSVNYTTVSDVAEEGSDYNLKTGTLVFPVGISTQTVTVTSIQESVIEEDEGFFLDLSGATNGAIISDGRGRGVIEDDETHSLFAVNDPAAVSEGGSVVFTVTRLGSTLFAQDVNYSTADGEASSSNDFNSNSGTLTFGVGVATRTVAVTTLGDGTYEADEVFYLDLSAATNGAQISDGRGAGTIANVDAAPSFTVNDVSTVEGGQATFTVTKVGASDLTHAVSFAAVAGSIGAGEFTPVTGALSFAPGVMSLQQAVTTSQDSVYEEDETLFLDLASPTNQATISDSRGVATVTSDDAAPSFAVSDVSVAEGSPALFIVTKTGESDLTHAVTFATAEGSAGAGEFGTPTGTLTFAPGVMSVQQAITTTADNIYEPDETFFLDISSPTNQATITDSRGLGTIENDDAPPHFAINDVTVSEGGGTATFTITKTGESHTYHFLTWATSTGTAWDSDIVNSLPATENVLSFPAGGDQTRQVSVTILEDDIFEGDESFYVDLSFANPSFPPNGATISDDRGVGIIADNDAGPQFTVVSGWAYEGEPITMTIYKLGETNLSHSVNFATSATGTAGSGEFTAQSGTVNFTPTQGYHTFTIPTAEDSVFEGNETFHVNLSSPTNQATILINQSAATITNDDTGPSFSFSGSASAAEGLPVLFTVDKSGSTELSHSVSYATSDTTSGYPATAGNDYTAVSGVLTFAPGETSKTISVPTSANSGYEPSERFDIDIFNPTDGAILGSLTGTVGIISDNDPEPNYPPIAVDDADSDANGFYGSNFNVLANDTDPNGDALVVTNAVLIYGTGTLGYTSSAVSFSTTTCGTHVIQYSISDGFGGTDSAAFVVDVFGCGGGELN